MSRSPEYQPSMSDAEVRDFKARRDAHMAGSLSNAVELARKLGPWAAETPLLNQLGQPAKFTSLPDPNRRHPVTGEDMPHYGADTAPVDKTARPDVGAMASGFVIYLGRYSKGAGETTAVYHPNGPHGPYISYVMHGEYGSNRHLKLGQFVAQGEKIGVMGGTGIVSGPHVHVVVWELNPKYPFPEGKGAAHIAPAADDEAAPPPLIAGVKEGDRERYLGSYQRAYPVTADGKKIDEKTLVGTIIPYTPPAMPPEMRTAMVQARMAALGLGPDGKTQLAAPRDRVVWPPEFPGHTAGENNRNAAPGSSNGATSAAALACSDTDGPDGSAPTTGPAAKLTTPRQPLCAKR